MFASILSSAARTVAPDAAAGKAWVEAQKDALKTGCVDAVLAALERHREAPDVNRLNGDWDAYWAALAANPPAPANLNRPEASPNVAA